MRNPRQKRLSDVELQETLDQMEQAMLSGCPDAYAEVESLTPRLWSARSRMPQILADRLASGRTMIPGLAFEMLQGFAGARAPQYLRKLAEDTQVDDIVRFGSRRRLGWPERGETKERRAFLSTLSDDIATLVQALSEASLGYPPDGEVLQEVLHYLLVMPPSRVTDVVAMSTQELGRGVAWVLRGLLHASEPAVRAAALEEIVAVADRGALGALDRVAATSPDEGFRSEIAAARRRLQMRLVSSGDGASAETLPPIHSAYLSLIDGQGGQVAIVVRQRDDGFYLLGQAFFDEEWGIKDSFGISRATWEMLQNLYGADASDRLTTFGPPEEGESAVTLVEVDPAAVRGAMAEALKTNIANSCPIPPRFEIWEPIFHDQDPPSEEETTVLPLLDDSPYADRIDLYKKSDQLLDHPFFEHWFFNPDEIGPLLASVPRPTDMRLTERQMRPLIEGLMDERARGLLRRRLQRQAWMLERKGDRKERDLALVAAARLAADDEAELVRLPLLRAMVRVSLENLFGVQFLGL